MSLTLLTSQAVHNIHEEAIWKAGPLETTIFEQFGRKILVNLAQRERESRQRAALFINVPTAWLAIGAKADTESTQSARTRRVRNMVDVVYFTVYE